tara:strand:- start:52 stop:165 length:114 start_codon:yes stop_codon:yes gene_type:complete
MNAEDWKNHPIRHGLNGGMEFVTNIFFIGRAELQLES